jgi:hypothetical protein
LSPYLISNRAALAWLPAASAALYLPTGLRLWFSVPNTGIAAATVTFAVTALPG